MRCLRMPLLILAGAAAAFFCSAEFGHWGRHGPSLPGLILLFVAVVGAIFGCLWLIPGVIRLLLRLR